MAEDDRPGGDGDCIERSAVPGMAQINQYAHTLHFPDQAPPVWCKAAVLGIRTSAAGRILLVERDQGLADAEVMAGEMLANGRGGPRDPGTARALFTRAAAAGHAGALFALGVLAGGGYGEHEDHAAAMAFFRRAAEQGHPTAQLMLGRYLARGMTGQPDPQEAATWLQRARAQGVAAAEAELAGLGLDKERPGL